MCVFFSATIGHASNGNSPFYTLGLRVTLHVSIWPQCSEICVCDDFCLVDSSITCMNNEFYETLPHCQTSIFMARL